MLWLGSTIVQWHQRSMTDRQTDRLSVHHSKLMQRTLQKCAESFVPGEYSRIAEKPVVFHTASYIFIYLVKIYSHLTCR